jgi:predicted transcriptional regulator
MSATSDLEDWLSESKSHSVEIHHDDGYGAACWVVVLYPQVFVSSKIEVTGVTPDGEDLLTLDQTIEKALAKVRE